MTDLDAFAIGQPGPATPTGAGPRRHRHHFQPVIHYGAFDMRYSVWECLAHDPPVRRDEAKSRAGRNARKRGNRIQRERNVGLGIRNLAGNNPNLDGISEMFASESKSGGAFSERYWRWLKGIPVNAAQTAVLIVSDAPGSGHRRRSFVVVEYDQWRLLHGPTGGEE